jgi:predicted phosphodiesterase
MKQFGPIIALATVISGWGTVFAGPGTFPAGEDGRLRFAVIGDSGTGKDPQYRIARRMWERFNQGGLDFVLMLGDNIYEHGSRSDYTGKFELPYAPLLSAGVRFFASLGNHDVRWGHWRHAIEYPLFGMGGRRYYTLQFGDDLAQFFALDSTTLSKKSPGDPQQEAWLEDELGASRARWRIAFLHHPLYSPGRRHGGNERVRESVEPILAQGRVNIVLAGHDHLYARLQPQGGIVHFVSGAAAKLRRGNLSAGSPLTACGNDQEHSFLYVKLDARELFFQAISESGRVFDQGTISYDSDSGLRLKAECQSNLN